MSALFMVIVRLGATGDDRSYVVNLILAIVLITFLTNNVNYNPA